MTCGNLKCEKAVGVQGNGHERDKLNFKDSDLYILDIYNVDQWPWDK